MPVEMDANFLNQQARLIQQAVEIGSAILTDSQRPWQAAGPPLDLENMCPGLNRDNLNELYPLIMLHNGSEGDAMACRVQGDYLASQERALRLRNATPVRCVIHAAGRRIGHGHLRGPLGRVSTYVQDLIVAGT